MGLSDALMAAGERIAPAALRPLGFQSRRVTTSGGRLHLLEVAGRGGPTLLLFHGLSSCGLDYAPLIHRLRGVFGRLVAVDLPGHGRSDVPAGGMTPDAMRAMLEEALDAAVPEPAVVLGNSLGGLVAARVALERPERVLALALVSPAGAPMTRGALADFLAPFDFADYGQALRFVDRFLARRSWLRFPLAWGVRVRMGRPGVRDLIARMRADQFLEAGELAALAAPSLLYWGRADHILPPHHLDFWRAHLPGVAVITPSAIGHAPYLDDLDGFAREVAAWARAAVGEEDSA